MMLKVGDEYLDFNDDVEVEKQSKLFEEIDQTAGDFSYQFEIPFTSKNDRLLTFPYADVSSKKTYKKIISNLLDNEGYTLYRGYLRVEKVDYEKRVYETTFFSGNSNWTGELSESLQSLDWSELDADVTLDNVEQSWDNTEGVVFRFFDSGNLITRSHNRTVLEDWTPCIFAKTILDKIFQAHQIKLQGELFNDWTYNNTIVASNTHDQNEIDDRTTFVQKVGTQHITTAHTIITFQDYSTYPYFNSPNGNWDLPNNQYIADSKSILRLEINFTYLTAGAHVVIVKNGVEGESIGNATTGIASFIRYVSVNQGDKIQIGVRDLFGILDIFTFTLKISPIFLYNILGKNVVPKWTQHDFVKNIFSLFNVVTDYDSFSKTLTVNFFDNVSSKPPVELHKEIQIQSIDYTDFISNYGKNNYFSYDEGTDEDLKQYNVSQFIKYGQGNIEADNDFLEPSVDVVRSDFTAPLSYINKQFGNLSLERTNIFELQDADSQSVNVTNNSGTARFNVSLDFYQVGNLIKIEMDDIHEYDGEWVITTVGSGYFEIAGLNYNGDNTGTATLQITKTTSNDNVYIFLDAGLRNLIDISTNSNLYIGNTSYSSVGYSYFNMLNINKPVNLIFGQSLSFGSVNNNLSYQCSLIDTYWQSFKRILNDPAKVYMGGYLSKKTFGEISPLNPVFIKSEETSNIYYINRVTGYKNSYTPCTMELIKL